MPKKKKLKLGSLKVQSFVTELGDEAKKAKGGVTANTQCIAGSCLECSEGICITDFGSDCVGTCNTCLTNCGTCGTCLTDCGTCETCGTCYITVPSCPQFCC